MSFRTIFYGIAQAVFTQLRLTLGIVAPTFTGSVVQLVDGLAPVVDASLGSLFLMRCTTNTTRVIGVPINGSPGQRIWIRIINVSGGILFFTSFNAGIKQPPPSLPGPNMAMEYEFVFDGVSWAMVQWGPFTVPV